MPNDDDETTTDQSNKPCLRERELADRWAKSTRTLQRWRAEQSGPAFLRIGRSIRYRLCDIEAFEESSRQESERAGPEGG